MKDSARIKLFRQILDVEEAGSYNTDLPNRNFFRELKKCCKGKY